MIFNISGHLYAQADDDVVALYTDDQSGSSVPMFSFGAGYSGQFYDLESEYPDHVKIVGDVFHGGGLILERMINRYIGFHSGMWYVHTDVVMKMNPGYDSDGPPPISDIESDIFTFPFYIIGSYKLNFLSIELLAGLNLSLINETILYGDMNEDGISDESDITRYTEYAQLGAGGGLRLKFHFFRFVDIFAAVMGGKYFTDFINADDRNNDDGDIDLYLYHYGITAGVLFKVY